jgi:hypothetical protein
LSDEEDTKYEQMSWGTIFEAMLEANLEVLEISTHGGS